VIALDGAGPNATGRGSIRSGGSADVHAALARSADLLEAWGGHAHAAGFTVAADRVELLRRRFGAAVAEQTGGLAGPRLTLDAAVSLEELDDRFWRDVARLPPHGPGNTEPLFGGAVALRGQRVVGGGRHLRLELAGARGGLCGIGFGMGGRYPLAAARLAVAFAPEVEWWRGRPRPQLTLRDLEAAEEAPSSAFGGRPG
jgi:single-stranded-DNA-specific exonuclease